MAMRQALIAAGRVALVFCVVTTAALAVFVTTLWASGFLTAKRVDAAVAAMRGETAPKPAVTPAGPVSGPTPGDLREMETLVTMAEARDRDLHQQSDRIRAERRAAEKAAEAKGESKPAAAPTGTPGVAGAVTAEPPATERFKANLDVLRSHVPKTAAALMADWDTTEIVGYLRAMKPYEAADIVGAMLVMGKKGETDYVKKAKDVQAALGK
jgi:hypothetical protein